MIDVMLFIILLTLFSGFKTRPKKFIFQQTSNNVKYCQYFTYLTNYVYLHVILINDTYIFYLIVNASVQGQTEKRNSLRYFLMIIYT